MKKLIFKLRLYWLIANYHKWAINQFPNSTAQSSLEGLKREIVEVEEELGSSDQISSSNVRLFRHKSRLSKEYVDCLMYILDSSRRAGISQSELFTAFKEKLEINKKRNWKQNLDKSYSHIK